MKKLFIVVLVLAFMLVPATALADVTYFEEDFESYPADIGYYPDSFDDFGTVPYVAEVVTQNGSNMFVISNEDPISNGSSVNVCSFEINPAETQVTLSFTFMSQIQDDRALMFFYIPDHVISVVIYSDGSIAEYPSNTPIAPPGTVVPGVYYDVKVVINIVTGTANFYVDNVLWAADFPCFLPGITIAGINIDADDTTIANGLGVEFYVDNIQVTGLYTDPVNPRTGDSSILREMLVKQ